MISNKNKIHKKGIFIMISVWTDNSHMPVFDSLKKDIKTDVLVIGGGIAGILCAHMLKEASIDYVLVESDTICNGITHNTTAKITFQHGLIYDKLIHRFGEEKTKMYLDANREAFQKFARLCQDIDCDYEIMNSFVFSLFDDNKIEKEINTLNKIGFDAEFDNCKVLPFSVAGAVKFKNQAQFNPLKFLSVIAKDLTIYEHTKVQELVGTKAITNHGIITANRFIVTTHFPFINKHGSYFLKMYQHRSYVIALNNAPNLHGMYLDEAQKGMSFRNYKDLLLIGGGDHKTGGKGGNWEELRNFAVKHYPQSVEQYYWATQDCMTLDNIPYIGQYSSNTENLYTATGFNKWGMTSSMLSAMILLDLIKGNGSPYATIFSPSRTILRPQLAINAFNAVTNLLTPTPKRCPHMGCALKWNANEHTWDCPCHGSRFKSNGELIDNPATKPLKIK